MITVFTGGGRFLAELDLPAVPRAGERVVLDGLWIVVDVTWELKDGGSTAQVSLEQTMPAATLPS
jgi:hypothetical protein